MQHVEKFYELVSKWKEAYVCTIQSYVGLKTPQNSRLLLYGRIVFEPYRPEVDQKPFQFETEHIFAGRITKNLQPGDAIELIEKAKSGNMDSLANLIPNTSSKSFSDYLNTNYHPLISNLFITGESRYSIDTQAGFPQHLLWEMKTADIPFDTLDELMAHCGLPPWDTMRNETKLELVAKAPGEIDANSIIVKGQGIIECRVAKALDTHKLKIGFRTLEENREIIRGNIKSEFFEWRDTDNLKIGKCIIPAGDAPVLEAYLSYDGVPLDQCSISDPEKHLNPRHAIHQIFDPKNEQLPRMLLKPEKDKAHVFEGAVSTLLTLLGFSVSNYGRFPKLQEGPDIIAITPSDKVAIVECTLGVLNQNDKISKLVLRKKLTREKLANAGYGDLEIQPVCVTLLSREEVAANLDEAGAHGIAVVCRENLEDALNQIELPLNAELFFNNLKKLIPPSSEKEHSFGNIN